MKRLFILIATAIAIDGFAEGKRTISYDGNEVREVNVTAFNAIETGQ